MTQAETGIYCGNNRNKVCNEWKTAQQIAPAATPSATARTASTPTPLELQKMEELSDLYVRAGARDDAALRAWNVIVDGCRGVPGYVRGQCNYEGIERYYVENVESISLPQSRSVPAASAPAPAQAGRLNRQDFELEGMIDRSSPASVPRAASSPAAHQPSLREKPTGDSDARKPLDAVEFERVGRGCMNMPENSSYDLQIQCMRDTVNALQGGLIASDVVRIQDYIQLQSDVSPEVRKLCPSGDVKCIAEQTTMLEDQKANLDWLKQEDARIRVEEDAYYTRRLKEVCKDDPGCRESPEDEGFSWAFRPDTAREAAMLQRAQLQALENNPTTQPCASRAFNGECLDESPQSYYTGIRLLDWITGAKAPARQPYTREEEDALSRVKITAEETRFTPSEPERSDDSGLQQSASCHTWPLSFLNSWNGCGSGSAPSVQSGALQQYRPYVDPDTEYRTLGDGSTVLISTTDDGSSGGLVYDPSQIEEGNPAEVVVTPLPNQPPIVANPDEITSTDDDDSLWWQSPYIQRVTDPAGNDVDWTEFYGGNEFFYSGANRQFSTAVPFSNELFNQSLAASAFGAFLLKDKEDNIPARDAREPFGHGL